MKLLNIKRIYMLKEETFGIIDFEGLPFALTLELPWRDNRRDESCIPKGEYICRMKISPNFGTTYEILDVPNRSDILFHKGNTVGETKGCILLGEEFGYVAGNIGVLASGKAFSEFMQRVHNEDQFKLIIEEI